MFWMFLYVQLLFYKLSFPMANFLFSIVNLFLATKYSKHCDRTYLVRVTLMEGGLGSELLGIFDTN